MSKPDPFTPLRQALSHSWEAADRVTYDLLFDLVMCRYCQGYPDVKATWKVLCEEFWQRVRSPDYEQEFRTRSDVRELVRRHDLLPGGTGPEQSRIMLSLMRISQHLNDLWDHVPDAFKDWQRWQWSPIDAEHLQAIDRLWLKRSRGKFGFTVQRDIFLDCGGQIVMGEDPRLHIKLADLQTFQYQVGWARRAFAGYPPFFNYQAAPRGHLPILSLHHPGLIQAIKPFDFLPDDASWQTPICQYYPWWILAHPAFAT
jgi:hypothetical protein